MKKIKKNFIFENDEEIKEFIKVLKEMRKCRISLWRSLPNGYGLHNGKASIPDYELGYRKSKLLRTKKEERR